MSLVILKLTLITKFSFTGATSLNFVLLNCFYRRENAGSMCMYILMAFAR